MKRSLIILLSLLTGTALGFSSPAVAHTVLVSGISQIKPPPPPPAPGHHPPRPRVTVHRRMVVVRRATPPRHPRRLHITLPHIKLPRHPGPPAGAPPPPRL